MVRSAVACVLATLLLTSCAGLNVTPVPDAAADQKALGIRYYGSSPYLLVYSDNDGGLKAEVIYLPDRTKLMSAHPYNYVASNATTLEFNAKGLLTSSIVDVDETVVPTAILSALKDVALASITAGAALRAGGEPDVPLPVLFKIVIDADGARLYDANGLVGRPGDPVTPPPSIPPVNGIRLRPNTEN